MKMQAGCIVKCNYDFFEEREIYGYNYPKKGDFLTIKDFDLAPLSKELLCIFEEAPVPFGLAAFRFDVVQDPHEGIDILQEVREILQS